LRVLKAEQYALHVRLAFGDELSEQQRQGLQDEWGEERETTFQSYKFTRGASGELSQKWGQEKFWRSLQNREGANTKMQLEKFYQTEPQAGSLPLAPSSSLCSGQPNIS